MIGEILVGIEETIISMNSTNTELIESQFKWAIIDSDRMYTQPCMACRDCLVQ